MSERFSSPLMYWAGQSVPGAGDEEVAAYNRFYGEIHAPEVVAANTFSSFHRYERVPHAPDRAFPPGFGPDFLSVFEVPNDQAAAVYFGHEDGPVEGRPKYSSGPPVWTEKVQPIWRIMWRNIWESRPSVVEPNWIRVVAMNPPDGATEGELAEWNDFYSDVHAPEAIERRRWTRGTRWQCERGVLHPDPGCPRYFALYEAVDYPGPSDAEVAAMDPWTEGPAIWKENVTTWALDYRKIPARE